MCVNPNYITHRGWVHMCHPCVGGVIRYLRQNHFRFYSFYCTIWWHALFRYRQYKYTVEYHSFRNHKKFHKKISKRNFRKIWINFHTVSISWRSIFQGHFWCKSQNFDRKIWPFKKFWPKKQKWNSTVFFKSTKFIEIRHFDNITHI